jgi:hypothetical protein
MTTLKIVVIAQGFWVEVCRQRVGYRAGPKLLKKPSVVIALTLKV